MIHPRHARLVIKQVVRNRTRSALTILGVATAMFLFVTVQTLQRSVQLATEVTAADTELIVFRAHRFCPATSRLPERYADRIARIGHVVRVRPQLIVVNNCGAALDVVTFRGVRPDDLLASTERLQVLSGSIPAWHERTDAALVGERLAQRRGISVGDAFDAAGVTVTVVGIIRSDEPQDQNVAQVDLTFLQRSAPASELGVVTQFVVAVDDPAQLESVAAAIDAEFRHDVEPTQTTPARAFIAQAGSDIVHLVGFTRFLGWGCLAAVLALVANAMALSVQDRIREHAILQTLGFRRGLIVRLIVAEGVLLGAVGGVLGTLAAALLVHFGSFTLSNEGLHILVDLDPKTAAFGLLTAAGTGVVAGLLPALRAARIEIATSFRAV